MEIRSLDESLDLSLCTLSSFVSLPHSPSLHDTILTTAFSSSNHYLLNCSVPYFHNPHSQMFISHVVHIHGASLVTSHPSPLPVLSPNTISATTFPVPGPKLIPQTPCPAATKTPPLPSHLFVAHPSAGKPLS